MPWRDAASTELQSGVQSKYRNIHNHESNYRACSVGRIPVTRGQLVERQPDNVVRGIDRFTPGKFCKFQKFLRCCEFQQLCVVCRSSSRCFRGSVAINAANRCGFIKQDLLVGDGSKLGVARRAAHVLVSSLQGKRGFFVIEQRRPPFGAVVTLGTTRNVQFGKLSSVNVGVTLFAKFGCGFEVRFPQLRPHVGRLMTINACDGAVRADQRKLCCAVIESG